MTSATSTETAASPEAKDRRLSPKRRQRLLDDSWCRAVQRRRRRLEVFGAAAPAMRAKFLQDVAAEKGDVGADQIERLAAARWDSAFLGRPAGEKPTAAGDGPEAEAQAKQAG